MYSKLKFRNAVFGICVGESFKLKGLWLESPISGTVWISFTQNLINLGFENPFYLTWGWNRLTQKAITQKVIDSLKQ